MASWCDLPADLLGLVAARLPNPADRVRSCAAVCRSWHSAVRQHEHRRLPWVITWELDMVLIASNTGEQRQRLPSSFFPGKSICIGSTGAWLAVGVGDKLVFKDHVEYLVRSYHMYNPFSGASLPLAELDDTIVNRKTVIYKFLMRSSTDDLIAAVTNNMNYTLIVFQPGKGAWVSEPWKVPYIYIIDVAFLGDTLYAITKAEDLISFDLALDGDGKPVVTNGRRVIRQRPGYQGFCAWSASDDDDDEEEEEEEKDDDEDVDEDEEEEEEEEEEEPSKDDGMSTLNCCSEYINESTDTYNWHLIESRGKLFMVNRQSEHRPGHFRVYTRRVDIFEADMSTGAWVPLPTSTTGLGGRALFTSFKFSKFVSTPCGDVEEDVVYDVQSGEVTDSLIAAFLYVSAGSNVAFPARENERNNEINMILIRCVTGINIGYMALLRALISKNQPPTLVWFCCNEQPSDGIMALKTGTLIRPLNLHSTELDDV